MRAGGAYDFDLASLLRSQLTRVSCALLLVTTPVLTSTLVRVASRQSLSYFGVPTQVCASCITSLGRGRIATAQAYRPSMGSMRAEALLLLRHSSGARVALIAPSTQPAPCLRARALCAVRCALCAVVDRGLSACVTSSLRVRMRMRMRLASAFDTPVCVCAPPSVRRQGLMRKAGAGKHTTPFMVR